MHSAVVPAPARSVEQRGDPILYAAAHHLVIDGVSWRRQKCSPASGYQTRVCRMADSQGGARRSDSRPTCRCRSPSCRWPPRHGDRRELRSAPAAGGCSVSFALASHFWRWGARPAPSPAPRTRPAPPTPRPTGSPCPARVARCHGRPTDRVVCGVDEPGDPRLHRPAVHLGLHRRLDVIGLAGRVAE
jgi:hypothetical protein